MKEIVICTENNAAFILKIEDGGGSISSNQHEDACHSHLDDDREAHHRWEGAIDGLESFLIALALNGVDVEDKKVVEAIDTALIAIGNHT